eukprot:GEMP01062593.1.p1 GENE.GEMP01062593.1~~GEMP01062593.1.p1  ORF type:complete len:329 (+),score=78.45 GEMP01062593.1:93-1079(+)
MFAKRRRSSFGAYLAKMIRVLDEGRQDTTDDVEAVLNLYLIVSTLMLSVFAQFFTILGKEDMDAIADRMENELQQHPASSADWNGSASAQHLVWWSAIGMWMMIIAMWASLSAYYSLNMGKCRANKDYFKLWFTYFGPILKLIVAVFFFSIICLLIVFMSYFAIRYRPDRRTQVLVLPQLWRHDGLPEHNIPPKQSLGRDNVSPFVIGATGFFTVGYVIYATVRVAHRMKHRCQQDDDGHEDGDTMDPAARAVLEKRVRASKETISALERHKVTTIEDLQVLRQNPTLAQGIFPHVGDYCKFVHRLPDALNSLEMEEELVTEEKTDDA